MKHKFKVTFLLILLTLGLKAQEKNVRGTISDDSGPIPGVSILVKNANRGTESDFDGNYQITVNSDAVLVFSFLGFQVQEIAVSNLTELDVVMKDDLQNLDEVVLIGYGSVLKEDISGSVASVEVSALENVPQMGIDQLLQGRASGVYVTPNSGQPGSSVSVRIRGVNSISGSSEPLYIVDGVPVLSKYNTVVKDLKKESIKKITVYKSKKAKKLYGSSAKNGCIVITTKKGNK